MRRVAEGVNKLEGLGRQAVVLYHVEKMSTRSIAMIYEKGVSEVGLAIDGAEREMAEHLGCVLGGEGVVWGEEVGRWLGELG